MSCVAVDLPPVPTPPAFAISPPAPPDFPGVNLCCKLLAFGVPVPPVSLGVAVPPAALAAINTALETVEAYLDALPLECPRE